MRKDPKLPANEFSRSEDWKFDVNTGEQNQDIVERYTRGSVDRQGTRFYHSFSGHERNRLFHNHRGERFSDISAISGLDNVADSRTFVLWDYDRDGWQDIALVNASTPLLNLYRNEIGRVKDTSEVKTAPIIALKFIGGNRRPMPSTEYAPRDGYGAIVTVDVGDMKIKREHRCGEGFAAQNSSTMIVGIGEHGGAKSVAVRWPSGTTQTVNDVTAGTLLIAYENRDDSPNQSTFIQKPYVKPVATQQPIADAQPHVLLKLASQHAESGANRPAKLKMYTTMATWCAACKEHLPQLAHLRSAFDEGDLQVYGVPIDALEGPKELTAYESQFRPAYELLMEIQPDQREDVVGVLRKSIQTDALPSTIVTDGDGRVLKCFTGLPTASEIGRLLVATRLPP